MATAKKPAAKKSSDASSMARICELLDESDSLLKESTSLREHTDRTLRRASERISRLR